jgi:hypothetical protein
LIVLGVVILLAIWTFFIRKPSSRVGRVVAKTKSKVAEKTTAVKEKVTSTKPIKEITKVIKEPVKTVINAVKPKSDSVPVESESEIGNWGSDPFIRDWVLSTEIKDLKVKAITQSGSRAYALINDQILEAGEIISGKRIVAIENDKVILEQGGKTFTLLLGQ